MPDIVWCSLPERHHPQKLLKYFIWLCSSAMIQDLRNNWESRHGVFASHQQKLHVCTVEADLGDTQGKGWIDQGEVHRVLPSAGMFVYDVK